MSDLIDRQQAIEAICMETCGVSLRNERCMVHCTEVQAVEKLPPAQPEPDQNGDLWITVPDIDKVTRIFVQESKSKFCRIFYEER